MGNLRHLYSAVLADQDWRGGIEMSWVTVMSRVKGDVG